MFNLSDLILNTTMVVVTIWIVDKFLYIFLEKRTLNILTGFIWILFGIFQFYIECHKGDISIWTTAINAIFVLGISFLGYEKKGRIKILLSLILVTMWSIGEMIVFIFLNRITLSEKEFVIIGAVLSKMLVSIGVYACSIYWKKKSSTYIPTRYYAALLCIPLGSIYIAMNEFYSKERNYNLQSSMIIFSILLLLNIIIFEIYSKLCENFLLEKEKTLYAQQLDTISKNTEEQRKMMEVFHEEKHNWVNKLIVLKDDVENSEKEKVIERLNQIIKTVNFVERISNSGNNTVDAIINFKYAGAKEQGIEFHLKIFIPETLPFDQCDLGIILGNVLDNAIEAVRNCRMYKKSIEISMGIKKESLILIVKNPYEHSLKRDILGNLLSTKKDSNRHGYGLASIKKIVQRYQGEVITDVEDDIFVLLVIMNLE